MALDRVTDEQSPRSGVGEISSDADSSHKDEYEYVENKKRRSEAIEYVSMSSGEWECME